MTTNEIEYLLTVLEQLSFFSDGTEKPAPRAIQTALIARGLEIADRHSRRLTPVITDREPIFS